MILATVLVAVVAMFLSVAAWVLWWVSPPRDAWDELARRDRRR